jgi:hypothetical protein
MVWVWVQIQRKMLGSAAYGISTLVLCTNSNCHHGSFAKLEAKNNSKEICGHNGRNGWRLEQGASALKGYIFYNELKKPRSADLEMGLSTGGGAGRVSEAL